MKLETNRFNLAMPGGLSYTAFAMRASQLLYISILVVSPAALAAPIACAPASVAIYTQQSEGCAVGAFTLKNFAWSSVQDTGYIPVSAADVLVTPMFTPSSVGVAFTSSAFSVTGSGKIRAFLDYTVDPPPPILDDLNLEMDANSPVAPGVARITANICIGGLFRNSCENGIVRTLTVEHFGPGNPDNVLFDTEQFPSPVNMVDVRTTIELYANGASSQIDGYGTITNAVSGDETPEPSTAALALSGLAGAIYLRCRKSRI
ncbi:MAG: PEP-CTERM sorting domain-containing protein [Bryobacteraceae bacterium]|nr:PEP-CTERM sorting domain-containing protein [Bryobacteraceae bacterium]